MTPLQSALAEWDRYKSEPAWTTEGLVVIADLFAAAARRWLDLQPEECGTCGGTGSQKAPKHPGVSRSCPTCHGSGHVYKTETVERIAKPIFVDWFKDDPGDWNMDLGHKEAFYSMAVAVLDALNEDET